MAISKLGGTTSDNWELISSVTPTAATASVNFTGLSPYRKLLIRWVGVVLNTSQVVGVRINNDSTGTNYTFMNSAGGYDDNEGAFYMAGTADTQQAGYGIFNNCDTTSIKELVNGGGSAGVNRSQVQGFYLASAIVTQINLITTSTFTAVGTVQLYGVK